MGKIWRIFAGHEGRKVFFGIWLFIASNAFLALGKIPPDVWVKCVFVAGALIGFGTLLDNLIKQYLGAFLKARGLISDADPAKAPTSLPNAA